MAIVDDHFDFVGFKLEIMVLWQEAASRRAMEGRAEHDFEPLTTLKLSKMMRVAVLYDVFINLLPDLCIL